MRNSSEKLGAILHDFVPHGTRGIDHRHDRLETRVEIGHVRAARTDLSVNVPNVGFRQLPLWASRCSNVGTNSTLSGVPANLGLAATLLMWCP